MPKESTEQDELVNTDARQGLSKCIPSCIIEKPNNIKPKIPIRTNFAMKRNIVFFLPLNYTRTKSIVKLLDDELKSKNQTYFSNQDSLLSQVFFSPSPIFQNDHAIPLVLDILPFLAKVKISGALWTKILKTDTPPSNMQ